MTIDTNEILTALIISIIQIIVYYQILTKPLIDELKNIKTKQDDIEQYRLKKMNYQLEQINEKLDKLIEKNNEKQE